MSMTPIMSLSCEGQGNGEEDEGEFYLVVSHPYNTCPAKSDFEILRLVIDSDAVVATDVG